MKYNTSVLINKRIIDIASPTYFIADLASNHNGDLEMAKELVYMAKDAGADAVKFQHFLAEKIVSDYGFRHLGQQFGHQVNWEKSVFETYKEAEFHREWTETLRREADIAGIDFFSSPYDVEALDLLNNYVPAYKIGSGDITWLDFIELIAKLGKPVLLATGASDMLEVEKAVDTILSYNPNIILMQCNTNYTANSDNYKYINLNVLRTYAIRFPGMILGLSDHTFGHATVLGAIALGARVIEKHFTLDNDQKGPDHAFSMNPESWKEMVDRARELENALGTGIKVVEDNEKDTVIIQRRCLRARLDIEEGTVLTEGMIEELRPAPCDAVAPFMKEKILGRKLNCNKTKGDYFRIKDVDNK